MTQRLAPGAKTLAAAARAVSAVAHEGRSADAALEQYTAPTGVSAKHRVRREDASAVRAIALGTLRWYLRLAPAMAELVDRPIEGIPPLLRALLISAAHQIEYSRGPAEVSVHLAVDAARDLELGRASGFVNAVLRRFVCERADLLARLDQSLAVRHAHPVWMVEALQAAWGDRLEDILLANNIHPPMTLRVAGSPSDCETYQRKLAAEGRASQPVSWLSGALQLEHPAPVSALPLFAQGAVSVQDPAAQLAAWLLPCLPGQRVLDACAAPGGKSAHLLQRYPGIDLLAVDHDAQRLRRVNETLARIGQEARTEVIDMTRSDALAGASFERILLDAPCSATGVIRRHPDIKLLRRPSDIAAFAAAQKSILRNAFARLAPGGRLLYVTCSVMPEENEQVVADFLAHEPSACDLGWPAEVPVPPGSRSLQVGMQLLPGSGADHDGFYYACLGRIPAGTV